MKILYVITGLGMDTRVGGGSLVRSMAMMAQAQTRGNQIHVLTTYGGKAACESRYLDATFHLLPASLFGWGPGRRSSLLNRTFACLISLITAFWIVQRLPRFDIIYTDSDVISDSFVASLVVRKHKIPWVATSHLHVRWIRNGLQNSIFTGLSKLSQKATQFLMRKLAARILLINGDHGRSMGQELIHYGIDEERITYVNNGVDLTAIRSIADPCESSYDACFVGSLRPSKGLEDLILIWRQVVERRPSARLLIIGGIADEYRKQIEKIIVLNSLESSIELYGHISNFRELIASVKRCKVYITAFREESFGMAVCEALSAGIPVVAYDLPVYRELFGGIVQTVPVGDIQAHASKTLKLLEEDKARNSLREVGKRSTERYDWTIIAERELAIFESCLHPPKTNTHMSDKRDPSILMIATGSGKSSIIGGSLVRAGEIASCLDAAGHDVQILTTTGGKSALATLGVNRNIHIIPTGLIPFSRDGRLSRVIAYFISSVNAFWKVFFVPKCQIVYTETDVPGDIIFALLYKIRFKSASWVAVVHHLRVAEVKVRYSRILQHLLIMVQGNLFRLIAKSADSILVLDSTEGEKVAGVFHRLGYPESKVKLVHNGANVLGLAALPLSERLAQGIFIGGFRIGKGVDHLAPIWSKVVTRGSRATLLVIGGGTIAIKEKLLNRIAHEGLEGYVRTLGYVSARIELLECFQKCRVLVFPSEEEGWGIPIAEAMSLGVPVVAWDLPVYHRIFPVGMVRVPIGDYQSFADAVVKILEDDSYAAEIITEGLQLSRNFNWETIAIHEAKILEEVLARRST